MLIKDDSKEIEKEWQCTFSDRNMTVIRIRKPQKIITKLYLFEFFPQNWNETRTQISNYWQDNIFVIFQNHIKSFA